MRAAGLLLWGVLIAAAACGSHRRRPATESSGPPANVTLQVTNHNFLDVTVFVLHDGARLRVGLVTGTSTQSFTLPGRMVALSHELALVGEALGSRAVARTETLFVQPGQRIEWTLETDLRRSSVGVY
jgi:hypothetical protein